MHGHGISYSHPTPQMARTKQVARKSTGAAASKAKVYARKKATPRPSGVKKPYRPGQAAMKEIRKYQRSTDLLIPKAPFVRLCREIIMNIHQCPSGGKNLASLPGHPSKFTHECIDALRESAEAYLVSLFESSVLCCSHAKRVTVDARDMQLARRLRGDRW